MSLHVAVIGLGPRGVGLLVQLVRAHRRRIERYPGESLHLEVYDPAGAGEGTHVSSQPGYLLTNTLASQVTLFPDASGPSLTEWARAQGYRRQPDGSLVRSTEGRPVSDTDHLPRSLLGRYGSWVFAQTLDSLPPGVTVAHHRASVIDLHYTEDGRSVELRAADGSRSVVDAVCLANGHGVPRLSCEEERLRTRVASLQQVNPELRYVPRPYPVEQLDAIGADSVVAVQGLGLTAYDVLAALTLGRGGTFSGDGDDLRYVPTGREPEIVVFSRSALPYAARGIDEKPAAASPSFVHLTTDAVARLRTQSERAGHAGQLDFDEQILPLLRLEMAHLYAIAAGGRGGAPDVEQALRAVDDVLEPIGGRLFENLEEYRAFFLGRLEEDLRSARVGNVRDPVKHATDLIREIRPILQDVVDGRGLTATSHRRFVEDHVPRMNRISFGPPIRRNEELIAVMKAGVVRLGGGPGAEVALDESSARFVVTTRFPRSVSRVRCDALIRARLDASDPAADRRPLLGNLIGRGLARAFSNGTYRAGGLDVDECCRVIDRTGVAQPRLYAVGYVTEGARYYTYALPRPGRDSAFHRDARKICDQVLGLDAGIGASA